ncbi:MAG: radical SAM protein [Candidatus Alcyoniella australis]|nr:radical SAM protein [Candidatus Alcyoniella australis]
MRVLFTNTNYQRQVEHTSLISVVPPLDLAYCAALVRREISAAQVEILDANALGLDQTAQLERIRRFDPQLLVLTAATHSINAVAGLLAGLDGSSALKVLIGTHGSALPEQTLEQIPQLDVVVRGEPEYGVLDIAQRVAEQRGLDDVMGLHYRREGAIESTPDRPLLAKLDSLPFPARDLLPNASYSSPYSDRVTALRATRGCPGRCSFCDSHLLFGARTRVRDPKLVADEIEQCVRDLGLHYIAIIDHTFTASRKFVIELCELLIERGLGRKIRWACNTRVDMLSDEMVALMRGAGCVEIGIGMEGAVNEQLAAVHKGITEQQIAEAITRIKRQGIVVMGYAIIGFPDDDAASIRATERAIKKLDPHVLQLSFATPLPGSRLRQQCLAEDRVLSDNWDDYVFLRRSIIRNKSLETEQLQNMRDQIVRSFYLRPRKLLQLVYLLLFRARISRFSAIRAGLKVLGNMLRR